MSGNAPVDLGLVHSFYASVYCGFETVQNGLCFAQDKAPIIGIVPAALMSVVSLIEMIASVILSAAIYVLPETNCPRRMLERFTWEMWDHGCLGFAYGIYNFLGLGFPLYHTDATTIQRLETWSRAEEPRLRDEYEVV